MPLASLPERNDMEQTVRDLRHFLFDLNQNSRVKFSDLGDGAFVAVIMTGENNEEH